MNTPIKRMVIQRQLDALELSGQWTQVEDLIRKYGHIYQLRTDSHAADSHAAGHHQAIRIADFTGTGRLGF